MSLLTFQQLTPEQLLEKQLLAMQNQKSILTPEQKFEKALKKYQTGGKHNFIRKFHFKAIEHGDKIHLFNGIGVKIGIFNNDFHGRREARNCAVDLFTSTNLDKRNGGYIFDFVEDN